MDIRRPIAGRNELGWSPDDRYFVFAHHLPRSQPAQLILLDIQDRIAINTCMSLCLSLYGQRMEGNLQCYYEPARI